MDYRKFDHEYKDDAQFTGFGFFCLEMEDQIPVGFNAVELLEGLSKFHENGRESFAWDTAFFTSAGLLDDDELMALITGSDLRILNSKKVAMEGDITNTEILKKEDPITQIKPHPILERTPKSGVKKSSSLPTGKISKCQSKQNIGKIGSGKAIRHDSIHSQIPVAKFGEMKSTLVKATSRSIPSSTVAGKRKSVGTGAAAAVSVKGPQPPKASSLGGPRRGALPKYSLSSSNSLLDSSFTSSVHSTMSSTSSDSSSSSNMSSRVKLDKSNLVTPKRCTGKRGDVDTDSFPKTHSIATLKSKVPSSHPADQNAGDKHKNQGVGLTSNNSKRSSMQTDGSFNAPTKPSGLRMPSPKFELFDGDKTTACSLNMPQRSPSAVTNVIPHNSIPPRTSNSKPKSAKAPTTRMDTSPISFCLSTISTKPSYQASSQHKSPSLAGDSDGRCDFHKSLAWDRAFFTSEGLLDAEELLIMSTRSDLRILNSITSAMEAVNTNTSPLKEDPVTQIKPRAILERAPESGVKKSSSLPTDRISKCQLKQNIGEIGSVKTISHDSVHSQIPVAKIGEMKSTLVKATSRSIPPSTVPGKRKSFGTGAAASVSGKGPQPPKASSLGRGALPKSSLSSSNSLWDSSFTSSVHSTVSSTSSDSSSSSNMSSRVKLDKSNLITPKRSTGKRGDVDTDSILKTPSIATLKSKVPSSHPADQNAGYGHKNQGAGLTSNNSKKTSMQTDGSFHAPSGLRMPSPKFGLFDWGNSPQQSPSAVPNGIPHNSIPTRTSNSKPKSAKAPTTRMVTSPTSCLSTISRKPSYQASSQHQSLVGSNGRFDLSTSLAWDRAFFTSEGLLDAEELLITSTGSDLRILNSKTAAMEAVSTYTSLLKKEDPVTEMKPHPIIERTPKSGVKRSSSLPTDRISKCQSKQNILKAIRHDSVHSQIPVAKIGEIKSTLLKGINMSIPSSTVAGKQESVVTGPARSSSGISNPAAVSGKGPQPPKASSLSGPRMGAVPMFSPSSSDSLWASSFKSCVSSTISSASSDSSNNLMAPRSTGKKGDIDTDSIPKTPSIATLKSKVASSHPDDQNADDGHKDQGAGLTSNNSKESSMQTDGSYHAPAKPSGLRMPSPSFGFFEWGKSPRSPGMPHESPFAVTNGISLNGIPIRNSNSKPKSAMAPTTRMATSPTSSNTISTKPSYQASSQRKSGALAGDSNGRFNLCKSLACDRGFFTSEGVTII